MNQILSRPSAALFPAVCLIAALMGNTESVFLLLTFYFTLQLLTLCALDAFRNAAAREPGIRRVDMRFGGAIAQILIGGAIFAAGLGCMPKPTDADSFSLAAVILPAIASGCIIIEQTFEERMFALSRPMDGALLAVIANLLMAIGLFIPGKGEIVLAASAGLGALIALIASLFIAPFRSFSMLPRNYGFAPKAALQTLLYPAAAAALMNVLSMDLTHALAGWVLWRLSRTTCRRSHDESRPMNLLLIALCAALIAAASFLPWAAAYALACLAALVCAAIVFLAPSVRLYAGMALLLAAEAGLRFDWHPILVCALCAGSIALNLKNAFLRKVSA